MATSGVNATQRPGPPGQAEQGQTIAVGFDIRRNGLFTQTDHFVTVRIELKDGAVYELQNPKEGANRVLTVIEDYRKRERYKPGSLFGDVT